MLPVFQLTAARRRLVVHRHKLKACLRGFNSQPPEGGWVLSDQSVVKDVVSTHSRPKAAGSCKATHADMAGLFQLTAARRRLVPPLKPLARKACIALFR